MEARFFAEESDGESGRLQRHPLLKNLGIEPLDRAFNGAALAAALAGRKASIVPQESVAALAKKLAGQKRIAIDYRSSPGSAISTPARPCFRPEFRRAATPVRLAGRAMSVWPRPS